MPYSSCKFITSLPSPRRRVRGGVKLERRAFSVCVAFSRVQLRTRDGRRQVPHRGRPSRISGSSADCSQACDAFNRKLFAAGLTQPAKSDPPPVHPCESSDASLTQPESRVFILSLPKDAGLQPRRTRKLGVGDSIRNQPALNARAKRFPDVDRG